MRQRAPSACGATTTTTPPRSNGSVRAAHPSTAPSGARVSTRAAAFHHVDDLLLAALPPGVAPTEGRGPGLRPGRQSALPGRPDRPEGRGHHHQPAAGRTRRRRWSPRPRLRTRALPRGQLPVAPRRPGRHRDLAFSIEAFVHSPDADGYFREAARTLRPGGKLILCDDFLTSAAPPPPPRAARWLDEFRTGWRVGSLLTADRCAPGAAPRAGPGARPGPHAHLELRRPRDRGISLLLAVGRAFRLAGDYWQSLVGGDALQWALIHGLLSYRFLELHRDR